MRRPGDGWHEHTEAAYMERERTRLVSMQCELDATARLAAVRAVLGERHHGVPAQHRAVALEWCCKCESVWPCLHERIFRVVEGTDAAGEAQP